MAPPVADAGGGAFVEVVKSPNDKKLYRYLTLESGCKVLLISDPQITATTTSDAAADQVRRMHGEYIGPVHAWYMLVIKQ